MKQLLVAVVAAVVATIVVAAGLTLGGPSPDQADDKATPAAATGSPVVIVISVDGFNHNALSKLPARYTNNFRAMRRYGTATTNARTAFEQTNTLPNHTGMMTGRRISGAPGHHVTFNSDNGSTLARVNGRYVPGIFDVAHDRGLSTAIYTSKSKFRFYDRSWGPTHGRPDTVGADDGRDKIDAFVFASPGVAAAALRRDLASADPRNLHFWHISLPDAAGHAHGFMSRPYLRAVRTTNSLLGQLFAVLRAHPSTRARTSVLLTADHGGRGASHRDPRKLHNYRVPLYTWGRGVSRGVRLYATNPGRLYPYDRRIGYSGRQPIRNLDVANTSLRLLGLPSLADAPAALDTTR
ncbi:MAG TPA: alkaline phosphatase family protein [Marmoricola sp.]|nr:alkaline phosphatase family protein [Marmoricola sp.]